MCLVRDGMVKDSDQTAKVSGQTGDCGDIIRFSQDINQLAICNWIEP